MRRNNEDLDGMMADLGNTLYLKSKDELWGLLLDLMDEKYDENDIRDDFTNYCGEIYESTK
jgi:hypothetical protein